MNNTTIRSEKVTIDMFLVTFLVLNTGRTEQELESNVFQAVSIAQKHNCELCRLDFQQEQGLMSSLPLADCQIEIQRGLTTSSTAIFVPFTTQELFDGDKESLYYGLNALSNNLIMVDMLNQANGDRQILAKQLNISPHQLSYVTHSGSGEGLLFYGNTILPFVDHFPHDLELYKIMTTKLSEVTEAEKHE